ncbi:MAG: ion transporter [Pedobacter sp.]|nr:MAG: ion transporter [Pedobacter sp.]
MCNTDSDCIGDNFICGKMIANPNWGITNFDSVASSFLMVFQVTSLEGWSDTMYYLDRTFSPFVAVYFIGLIIIGTFFLLNLFIIWQVNRNGFRACIAISGIINHIICIQF